MYSLDMRCSAAYDAARTHALSETPAHHKPMVQCTSLGDER